jgi:hypothetical protein
VIPQLGGSGIEQAVGPERPSSTAGIKNAALRHKRILHEFSTAVSAIARFIGGIERSLAVSDAAKDAVASRVSN